MKTLLTLSLLCFTSSLSFADHQQQEPVDQATTEYCKSLPYDQAQQDDRCTLIDQDHQQGHQQDQDTEQVNQNPDTEQNVEQDHQQDHEQDSGYPTSLYRTARWVDYGEFTAFKLFDRTITIDLHGRAVTEIILRANNATIKLHSALAFLSNGDVIDLVNYTGKYISEDAQIRTTLTRHMEPLHVEKLEITFESTAYRLPLDLGALNVSVGFAQ